MVSFRCVRHQQHQHLLPLHRRHPCYVSVAMRRPASGLPSALLLPKAAARIPRWCGTGAGNDDDTQPMEGGGDGKAAAEPVGTLPVTATLQEGIYVVAVPHGSDGILDGMGKRIPLEASDSSYVGCCSCRKRCAVRIVQGTEVRRKAAASLASIRQVSLFPHVSVPTSI